MSRKNKTLRAFLHQNQNPTIKQAWDAAWKHAQKTFHARSIQDMEEKLATAQAENEKLVKALSALRGCITETCGPDAHSALVLADAALTAYRKQRASGGPLVEALERRCIVDADYSQIELRIMAHLSRDQELLDAFSQGLGIHRVTAAGVSEDHPADTRDKGEES